MKLHRKKAADMQACRPLFSVQFRTALLFRDVFPDIQRVGYNDYDTLCDVLVVGVDAEELETGLQ